MIGRCGTDEQCATCTDTFCQQQQDWIEQVLIPAKAAGKCPHSGYTLARCRASVCDCFDPYATDGDIHPEFFTVGGAS